MTTSHTHIFPFRYSGLSILFTALFLAISFSTKSETSIIWEENFSLSPTEQNRPDRWTLLVDRSALPSKSFLGIRHGAFVAQDIRQTAIWKSPTITIQDFQQIHVHVDLFSKGLLDKNDFVKVFYRLDHGNLTPFPGGIIHGQLPLPTNKSKKGLQAISSPGLVGHTLEILIEIRNASKNEIYGVNSVTVMGNYCPNTIFASNQHLDGKNPTMMEVHLPFKTDKITWQGPFGFESDERNPDVTKPGQYEIIAEDEASGCFYRDIAQVFLGKTIWMEDFDLPFGLIKDEGMTSWTATTDGHEDHVPNSLGVRNEKFVVQNSSEVTFWESEPIKLPKGKKAQLSLDMYAYGLLENHDFAYAYLQVDDQPAQWLNPEVYRGNFNHITLFSDLIEGETAVVMIRMRNSDLDEIYAIDNIRLFEPPEGPLLTAQLGELNYRAHAQFYNEPTDSNEFATFNPQVQNVSFVNSPSLFDQLVRGEKAWTTTDE